MNKSFWHPLAVTLTTLVLLGACTDKKPSVSFPFKAQIIELTGLDADGRARFGFANREFKTLRDLDNLDGDYLKMTQGGNLYIASLEGSLVEADRYSDGLNPQLRYDVVDGVIVPKDYSSLVMMSAYYQFDYLYSQMEDKLGFKPASFFENLPVTKIEALFEPKISILSDSTTIDATGKLNAAFSPQSWQFILFQRSAIERMPLAVNLQVLAHEFGHSIFQKYFYKGQSSDTDPFQLAYAYRGLNEGFADFISYIYTGSTDVLRASLSMPRASNGENIANERDFRNTTFSYKTFATTYGSSNAACQGSFYCLGTIFARTLYNAKQKLAASGTFDEAKFTPALIGALDDTLAYVRSLQVPADVSTEASDNATINDIWFMSQFFNGLIQNMPTAVQSELCTQFTSEDSFGEIGYPKKYRVACGN